MTGRGLEIDCKDLVELVTDYLEGVLAPADVERFEDHLALCDGCDVYVEHMRQTIEVVGALSADDVPAPARTALLTAFREWRGAP
jgi:anti-sigma factor RsiW